ncbi:MAG: hypothetical protein EOP49_14620 [Sphingobacteriales bacterium]|nr:MAG: hypothetical protein EOP49_14620 [Sphingobacteriales bacterium]
MRCSISILILIASLCSCRQDKLTEKQVEEKARTVIRLLGDQELDTFRHWGFGLRGGEIWVKLDTPSYGIFYFDQDTMEISVGEVMNFALDFPMSVPIDTAVTHRVFIKQLNGSEVSLSGWTMAGKDLLIRERIAKSTLFTGSDPFPRLKKLSALRKQLDIRGSSYRPDLGNFVQFVLTPEHVLTYLPDSLYINPLQKENWTKHFSSGKMLNKNWNLRKLDRPIDNG